jgi:hypothetical protein
MSGVQQPLQIVPFAGHYVESELRATSVGQFKRFRSKDDKPEASLEPIRYEAIDMHGPNVGGGTIRRPPRRQLKITAWAVSMAAGRAETSGGPARAREA